MRARNRARYLAPVALIAAVVATLVVISNGVHSSPRGTPSTQTTTSTTTASAARGSTHQQHATSTYTVKAGDTLSAIAVKTGVSVATLESLNPNANPNALQTGERLRLR